MQSPVREKESNWCRPGAKNTGARENAPKQTSGLCNKGKKAPKTGWSAGAILKRPSVVW
jgi:hypothetical protein